MLDTLCLEFRLTNSMHMAKGNFPRHSSVCMAAHATGGVGAIKADAPLKRHVCLPKANAGHWTCKKTRIWSLSILSATI